MKAINLHLPHLQLSRIGRSRVSTSRRWAAEHLKIPTAPVLGNAWALLLAAIVAMAVLIGLWLSSNAPPLTALPAI